MTIDEMKVLADRTVKHAVTSGAETAEVGVIENTEFEATVRNGSIETLLESVSNHIMIQVSVDKRKATVTSSDLSETSIEWLIGEAIELAHVMDPDLFFDLPDPEELGSVEGELKVYDPETLSLPTERKIQIALDLERAACSLDRRIISNGATFSNDVKSKVIANSLGFCDGYRKTSNLILLSCAAEDKPKSGENTGKKQSSFWYSAAPSFEALEPIEHVAGTAVSRTLEKLGAVRPKTCEVPVVFDPHTAAVFLEAVASAVDGGNIYRKSSFLVDKLDQLIGSPAVTIIDDASLAGKLGTRPFDEEGVRSRRTIVMAKGRLKSYRMDSYQARKLDKKTTGNSGDTSNFYIEPGLYNRGEIIATVREGLFLTMLFGPGANWVTGDFSQGAQGIWIENGELAYPVDGFTITSTFLGMLDGIEMIANDLDWRRSTTSPTFKVKGMTISGT
ncbi:MAG: TldD/PmbA family protein [bacterium]|nr:MAG: TldD/PmbA family protein [bacterium]